MRCNHCLTAFHAEKETHVLGTDNDSGWAVDAFRCPQCNRFNLYLASCDLSGSAVINIRETSLFRPKGATRPPPPPEVPKKFAEDYIEACLVLPDSAKASAALSRRCLQHMLREHGGVKSSDLASEIEQVLKSGKLPTHLAESLDAVRNTGNFAAHPIKSKSTGEIVPVEPGEAEWNLDVLDAFFDFYFVQPAILKRKREALNKKLADAGKPPMKRA